jgi:selenide,water dikinase
MGATPITALNLVAWSLESLGGDALRDVLRGGADIAREAGAAVVGGHSIDDPEPKYGMAVTGTVHPERLVRNSTGRPGDDLFLTKPLGGGVASTAAKRGTAPAELVRAATEVMTTLNREASGRALAAGATAMTDVTGFGLLGHLHHVARESGLAAEVDAAVVPAIDGVVELLSTGRGVSGGSRRNAEWAAGFTTFDPAVPEWARRLVTDATTSGGLLVALPRERAAQVPGVVIGRLGDGPAGTIRVHAG